jgi:hypothetical protein
MKSILEKALVHLLNEESEKAQELMHQFVVERARAINESLREGDEADLEAVDASLEEEFFTEADLDDAQAADQLEDDLDGGDADAGGFADAVEGGADDMGAEGDMDMGGEGDADADMGGDVDGETVGDDADLSSKIDNIEDEIKSLQAEFDKIMAEFDVGSDDAAGDDMAVADDSAAVEGGDDMNVASDDEEFDDITESMVDDLKKITTPNDDGKGANGEKLGRPDVDSPIAKDAKNRVLASKNTVGHTGWERETAPSKKDGPDRGRKYDNNRVKSTTGNSSVPATGPKGAEINKPVQGNTKSVIPGGKVTKK